MIPIKSILAVACATSKELDRCALDSVQYSGTDLMATDGKIILRAQLEGDAIDPILIPKTLIKKNLKANQETATCQKIDGQILLKTGDMEIISREGLGIFPRTSGQIIDLRNRGESVISLNLEYLEKLVLAMKAVAPKGITKEEMQVEFRIDLKESNWTPTYYPGIGIRVSTKYSDDLLLDGVISPVSHG